MLLWLAQTALAREPTEQARLPVRWSLRRWPDRAVRHTHRRKLSHQDCCGPVNK
jgi:hypothetical protein